MAQPSYTIIVEPDDNGWLAYMPALPGCHAPGDTIDEALQELQVVFEMLLEEYEEEQTPLPPDVSVTVGAANYDRKAVISVMGIPMAAAPPSRIIADGS